MADRPDVTEPTFWRQDGWTARIVSNEEDEGWAVEMTRDGDPGPALVGPWTMGRNKKDPKPMDRPAFLVLIKTAKDVMERHEHHARSLRTKRYDWRRDDGSVVRAVLEMVGDEDEPELQLVCTDLRSGEELWAGRVSPTFKLDATHLAGLVGVAGS